MQYPVMEHFYTLQGEGRYAGSAAYFIRLAGCDIGCHWCDVKESWDAGAHKLYEVQDLLKQIPESCPIVVITGGEPTMYDLSELITALHDAGKRVHIETSGAYFINNSIDWICVSPKKFKNPTNDSLQKANELKVIVFNKSDLDWAEENAALVSEDCLLYLQPEWSVSQKMNPQIIEYIKANPKWNFSLQTHKYLDIP